MTDRELIEDLQRRVRDLETRPVYPQYIPVPQPYPVYPQYPMYPWTNPNQPWITW